MAKKRSLQAQFVNFHYVNSEYHKEHPQLLHRHSSVLELLYFSNGEGRYFVSDRAVPVRRGNLVICNAQVKHGELAEWGNDLESYCCVYRGIALPGRPENTITKPSDPLILYFFAEQTMLEYIILALQEQFRKAGPESNVCQLLGNAVLNLVCDKVRDQRGQKQINLDREGLAQSEPLVSEIIAYIDEHLYEPITLEEIAGHFFISMSHLSHTVKSATGISPMRYVLIRRVGEAQNYLMNTSMTITKISEQLGFGDNVYFSRIFKKLVGITPTEYRKNFR